MYYKICSKKIITVFYGLIGFSVIYVLANSLIIDYRFYLLLGTLLAFLIILFLFAILTWRRFSNTIFSILKKVITYEKLRIKIISFEKEIKTFQLESKNILKDTKNLLYICFLNFCKLTCLYAFPLIHFLTTINSDNYILILFMMAVCNMLSGVIPTPYGFGSLEFICLILFGQIINDPKIISMLLLYRFFTDVFPLTIGGICFIYNKRKKDYILQDINS
ncbi:MAG: lysylphosphatidylglycerol synthase domain-containing protein [Coprobacillaceae bacterium]